MRQTEGAFSSLNGQYRRRKRDKVRSFLSSLLYDPVRIMIQQSHVTRERGSQNTERAWDTTVMQTVIDLVNLPIFLGGSISDSQ